MKSVSIFLPILSFWVNSLQAQESPNVCEERFTIVSDLSFTECPNDTYLIHDYSHGCLPACVFIGNPESHWTCNPNPCPPGYECNKDSDSCQLDEDSCFKYYVNYDENVDGPYLKAMWKPECTTDGKWAARQCKGEEMNGKCFCFDEIGNRIFGQSLSEKAQNMTCACSRKRAELEMDSKNWFVSLHCDDMGNYEPLQCSPDDCWCVETKTGEITSPVLPASSVEYLPCYDEETFGSSYLRQCESYLYAQSKIRKELFSHGTTQVTFDQLMCNPDGGYGRYSIQNGIAYCTWKDNSKIGSNQANVKINEMDCNCARDTKILELEGQSQHLDCLGNGNYKPLQMQGDQLYCVDSDGFAKSDLFDGTEEEHANAGTCEKLK